jgi:glycosyltransferase involved in cell wall biosynthesis
MPSSVSVICTFLNAEDTLEATLRSLEDQTAADAQFILVDDGSVDRSVAIAEAFCRRDPRFVLYKNPVRGRGHALNFAVAKASSEHVAILDADDLAYRTWLDDALMLMRERPEFAAIGFERLSIRADEQPQWEMAAPTVTETAPKNVTRGLARANLLPHSGAIIRQSRLAEVGGYDARRQSLFDYDLWIRLAVAGHQLGRSELIRIAKRYHRGQKFAHSKRYALASLKVQYRAILGIDRDYRNFVWLAWRAIREFARYLRRALAPESKGR